MLLGYARVSTEEQNAELQITALEKAGCDRIFLDQGISGSSTNRPALEDLMDNIKPGDQIVIWRLDRLSRSLTDLLHIVKDLKSRGADFRSLTEAMDTSTAGGTLMFHILGALSQFERSLISERTRAGMKVAHLRGKTLGRPKSLSPSQTMIILQLADEGNSITKIARQFGISRSTVYRMLAAEKGQNDNRSHSNNRQSD